MKRTEIPFDQFNLNIVKAWQDGWFLLTAGRNAPGQFNMMTVSWGSLGVIWGRPFAMVVVRPSRHTHGFTEKHDTFTLSAFGPECRRQLELCGAASGRDTDKVKATGLTPVASTKVEAPAFDQAELVLECRKIYRDKIDPGNFLADDIEANYKGSDYHTVYFGEILAIHGVAKYRRR